MTRRIRFTPLDRLRGCAAGLALSAAVLAAPAAVQGADVPFGPAAPVGTPTLPVWLASGDLDADGDQDIASAGNFGIAWHENVGGSGAAWVMHTVTTDTSYRSVVQGDVDRDGDPDLLIASLITDRVLWYENSAGDGSAWTRRTVSGVVDGSRFAILADVDRDGDPDVVSPAVGTTNALFWYENTAGNGLSWVQRTIATGVWFAVAVSAADVDRDGDLDVMASSANDDTAAWYENVDGSGGVWATRTIANPLEAGADMLAADVDGDGDVDAVVSPQELRPLFWFENVDGHGATWTARTIATPAAQARSVSVSDLDGDGDVDVLAPQGNVTGSGTAVWYENVGGDGTAWIERTIGTIGPGAYQVVAADVDGDGDQDAASVSFYGNEIVWYRNQSIHQAACFVPQPDIASGPVFSQRMALSTADVDGDGDRDALSAVDMSSTVDARIAWHRNLGGATAWSTHAIATDTGMIETIRPADIDGDADVDFVSQPQNVLTAFRNVTGDGSTWATGVVAPPPFTQSSGVFDVVDLDRDGDVDVVHPDNASSKLSWFENPGAGSAWVERTIAVTNAVHHAAGTDIDGDADLDVVVQRLDDTIDWYENLGAAAAWGLHTIAAASLGQAFVVGDVDGDGDTDLLLSRPAGPGLLGWLENNGNGTVWTLRTVVTSTLAAFWTDAADLDGDGDLDGLVTKSHSEPLDWYENAAGNGTVWVRHPLIVTSAFPGDATGIAADLDHDGDRDVLTARHTESTVGWARNDPGQALLDLADQVPPSANNNDVFSMLRVTVTHGGRAGDSDLELARIGLRFQEDAASDPLSTAEANALVEELRVYRDANGNGTFEPGTDTLVTTVATLSLTNGVQSIPFADGDPNVRVAFGTPATFFVVAQLTANASEQAPNQFRVVHLATGATATVAEDRSADLPLRTACPADFDSRIIGPVVPVELMGFTIE